MTDLMYRMWKYGMLWEGEGTGRGGGSGSEGDDKDDDESKDDKSKGKSNDDSDDEDEDDDEPDEKDKELEKLRRTVKNLREEKRRMGRKSASKSKSKDDDDDDSKSKVDYNSINSKLLRAEVKAAAVNKGLDPKLAAKLITLDEFEIDGDGPADFDEDEINEALDDLLEEYPTLKAGSSGTGKKKKSGGGINQDGDKKSPSMNDLLRTAAGR